MHHQVSTPLTFASHTLEKVCSINFGQVPRKISIFSIVASLLVSSFKEHLQRIVFILEIIHSVSLGTDSPYQTTTQQFFLSSQEPKNLIGSPRQTKSSNNSNVLHMFNSNTYTDFRTACKHILIPSNIIQVI